MLKTIIISATIRRAIKRKDLLILSRIMATFPLLMEIHMNVLMETPMEASRLLMESLMESPMEASHLTMEALMETPTKASHLTMEALMETPMEASRQMDTMSLHITLMGRHMDTTLPI